MKNRNPVFLHYRRLLAGLAVLMGAVSLHAVEDLVERSPFIPEGWSPPQPPRPRETPPPPAQPQVLDSIEFRGMTKWQGEYMFSLFDPTERRSFWLGVNQSDSGFTVTEFNERDETVVVRHENRTRTVGLRESQVQAIPETAEASARPAQTTRRPSSQQQQAQSPEERMQQLAEEIRRRRAARRQVIEETQADTATDSPSAQQSGGVPPAIPQ